MNRDVVRGLLLIFLIRLALALLPSFQVDMGAWLAWAYRLAEGGTAEFYSDSVWTQYTPGFLYWLLIIGKLGWVNMLSIKIPVILADMLCGYLIWKVVKRVNPSWAKLAFVVYVLGPVAIFDGSIWGQIDGVLTLAMYSSSYLLIEKKRVLASFAMLGVAILLKPQAVAILPVMLIATLVRQGWRQVIYGAVTMMMVVIAGFYPFYPDHPTLGMIQLLQKMGESYPYTSLFAFNIWSYIGMWQNDATMWQGYSFFAWGVAMMGVAYIVMWVKHRKSLHLNSTMYLMLATGCLIFFLFPTRVHERYLYPFFAYLLTYAFANKSKPLIGLSVISMILYSLNLYYPYAYYESVGNPLKSEAIMKWIESMIPYLAASQVVMYLYLWLSPAGQENKESIPVTLRHDQTIKHGSDKNKRKRTENEKIEA